MPATSADALPLLHDEIGSGPTLVLLPGALAGWASWEAHARALAATHRVVRLQLLAGELAEAGHRLPASYSTDAELDGLEATLRRLGDGPVDLVGWCYGAGLALAHALRHPSSVRTLTIVEPPAWPVWFRDHHASALGGVQAFDVPTLLVRGSRSWSGLPAIADVLAATLPRVRQLELPGGHACHLEQSPRFLAALAAHLADVPSRAVEPARPQRAPASTRLVPAVVRPVDVDERGAVPSSLGDVQRSQPRAHSRRSTWRAANGSAQA